MMRIALVSAAIVVLAGPAPGRLKAAATTAQVAAAPASAQLVTALQSGQVPGAGSSRPALVTALRAGGFVIVMRHASSPRQAPDKQAANADNVTMERQLDEAGRASATAMGEALRRLKIPIGDVLTSPTYRARETVRLARLPDGKPSVELGDNGQSMKVTAEGQAAWLRKKVTEFPRGTNIILVTHMPNIAGAFPEAGAVADGEALVFGPDGKGGARIVGRIPIEEWPSIR